MRLTDLEPRWYAREGGKRQGLTFRCPHCVDSGQRLAVAVHLDGTNMDPNPENPQQWGAGERVWTFAGGQGFDDLSITPSVDASAGGHWHGCITNGEIVGGI